MDKVQIKPLTEEDKFWVSTFTAEQWGAPKVVMRGHVYEVEQLPGFKAVQKDENIGLITYRIHNDECEIVTLNSLVEGMGIGTELLKAVIQQAASSNCKRIWTVTTNDNVTALRFYQTRGFVLAALHRNAVEKSRELKPEIPAYGHDSIPIRDEIEVEINLTQYMEKGR